MLDWLRNNDWLWWALGVLTVVSFLTAMFAVPWALARMDSDYFMPERVRPRAFPNLHPALRWTGLILKNVMGGLLVTLGLVFLLTPGQGLLTILTGVLLMNFPGKRALELWIIRFPLVLRAVNWLRGRRHREPLRVPERG